MDKEDGVCVCMCVHAHTHTHTHTHTYIYIHTDIHTMEYYLAIKNEILPFATIWIDLEDTMLSEISQT